MTISARVIEDSMCHNGRRITTIVVTFPRFILPELLTHRQFSRNTASSRAVPVKRMLGRATAKPSQWGANAPGMQAKGQLAGLRLAAAQAVWETHRALSKTCSRLLAFLGAHKQVANRLVEPHLMVEMIVTATDWVGFLKQRLSPDAQPEMQELARAIEWALVTSRPKWLEIGQWHLPFVTDTERKEWDRETLKLTSAARCARVSYLNHDLSSPDIETDMKLAYKLLFPTGGIMHASPFEHQASPCSEIGRATPAYNLNGWQSFRWELDTWWPDELTAYWENYQFLLTEQELPC